MSIKISELPSAETLGENDIVPIVQDGTTKKITAGTFKAENATVINSSSTNNTPAGAKAVYDYAAPISHADENTTYGQGTESKYGHCKTINNLTASEYTAGEALSSYQGKLLKDAIDGLDEDKQDVIDALHKIGSDSVEDGTFEGNEQSNRFIKVIEDARNLEVKDFATGTYLLKAGVYLALNGVLPAEIVNFGNDTLMITKAADTAVFYYIFDNTDNEDHCRLLYGYENITERTGTHKYLNIDDIPSTAGGNIDITNGVISTIGNTIRTLDATNDIIINNLNVGVYQVRDNATYKFKSGTGDDYVSFTISSQTFMVVSQIEAELPAPTIPKYYYIVDIQNGDVHYGYCKWLNSTQGYSGRHYIIDQSELVDKDYLETKLAEKQAEIDQLYDQIPTATATGDYINIQDSSNLPIQEFDMLGNATQQTYTGKNLLNYADTFVDGITTFSIANVEPNTTYYCKAYNVDSSYSGEFSFRTKLDGVWTAQNSKQLLTGFSYTTPNNCTGLAFNGLEDPAVRIGQIEQGASATSFEPYTGGTPAPNPDYPQDIHVVTGDNTVNIGGKNILQISTFVDNSTTKSGNGVTATINSDGSITLTGTASANINWFFTKNDFASLIKGNFYYLCDAPSANCRIELACKIDGTTAYLNDYGTGNKRNATTSFEFSSLKLIVNSGTATNVTLKPMVALGTTVTEWTPYITPTTQLISLGNIELAKIGNYTDRIFKDSGKWYKYGAVGKVVLNGSENYSFSAGNKITLLQDIGLIEASTATTGYLLCNYYQETTSSTDQYDYAITRYGSTSSYPYQKIVFKNKDMTSASSFQTWLGIHNTIVYYLLATPTTTEITDTTLIAQLENILQMRTIRNTTNGWIEPSGTNAQAGLTLTYKQDLATLIAG